MAFESQKQYMALQNVSFDFFFLFVTVTNSIFSMNSAR